MVYGDSDHTILNRILDLLADRKIKSVDFARDIGLAPNTVTNWKSGISSSYLKKLDRIATYFGVSAHYLEQGDEEISEEDELLNELKNRPEMHTLFSLCRNATADDIYKAIGILTVIKEQNKNG